MFKARDPCKAQDELQENCLPEGTIENEMRDRRKDPATLAVDSVDLGV